MTSDSKFKARFWQEVDNYFWVYIRNKKRNNFLHRVRIKIATLSYKRLGTPYKLFGPRYFQMWARTNPKLKDFLPHFDIEALDDLYAWLGDDYSKKMMIRLIARRLLPDSAHLDPIIGFKKQTAAHQQAEGLIKNRATHTVKMGEDPWTLNFYDLSSIGYPLNAHMHGANVVCTFIFEQYRYKQNNMNIGVEEGNIAIDGGGCWGDTALYMASEGAERVYCFEFSEDNLKVLDENLAANPTLAEHITLVKKAIWNEDGVQLHFQAKGPATSVIKLEDGSNQVETVTLDALVEQMKIERVDFIKMDIEGAEMNALEGARKTIARFGTKLAITVYHKPEDLFTIPHLIKGMRADYEFYLDHFTTDIYETVLFAIPKGSKRTISQLHTLEAVDPVPN